MKKINLSKLISALVSFGFVAMLFAGMFLLIRTEKITFSYFENRNLTAHPELSVESVMDGKYFTRMENYLKEHAPFRDKVLHINTKADMYLWKRPVVNDVAIVDDYLLSFNRFAQLDNTYIREQTDIISDNLEANARKTESYGGEFYYVAVPCQYVCLEDKYPWYLNNRDTYTDRSAEVLFEKLDSKNVKYIDMLDWYEEEGKPISFTSAVDNHYGIEGGYAVYSELVKRINADTDLNVDMLDEGEYTLETLQNKYLGSRSRKLFGLYPTNEKLSVIKPNTDVPFTRYNFYDAEQFKKYDLSNPATPTVYDIPESVQNDVLYGLYMGGDIAATEIRTDRKDLPSIFVYGDSFTNAVESVLWYSFDSMYSADFRHLEDMTPQDFIEKYKPDIVVCIRDYEAMLAESGNGQ